MADTGRFRERLIDLLSEELKGWLFIFHIANVAPHARYPVAWGATLAHSCSVIELVLQIQASARDKLRGLSDFRLIRLC